MVADAVGGGQVGQVEDGLAAEKAAGCTEGLLVGGVAAQEAGVRALVENRAGQGVEEHLDEQQLVGQGGTLLGQLAGALVDLVFQFGAAAQQVFAGLLELRTHVFLGGAELGQLTPRGVEGGGGGEVEARDALAALHQRGQVALEAVGDAPGDGDGYGAGKQREQQQDGHHLLQPVGMKSASRAKPATHQRCSPSCSGTNWTSQVSSFW